ncbi:hypothetical protein LCGC14_1780970 [marine sediment metagenome]|uniref:DUF6602 domain-containing protein n=1 Tax=marine sediment metagenome TaxID=412755 RepID=A0A0F9GVL0_9ZZZZ
MSNLFNMKLFHKSTTDELKVIKNRVRNLIGNRNWGEEGRYKEAILRSVIKRFLPQNFIIGTGFIIKRRENDNEINRYDIDSSRQIDILIFDATRPILFSEGDFYIVTPNSVRAIIEVKTNIENQNLTEILKRMNEMGEFTNQSQSNQPTFIDQTIIENQPIFNGIFSYEGYHNITNQQDVEELIELKIKEGARGTNYVNHISLNENIFIKNFGHRTSSGEYIFDIFSVYKIEDLSFSYFISNLLSYLVKRPITDESDLWFPTDKEQYNLKNISLID